MNPKLYYTFSDSHHHSIFICTAERCNVEVQVNSGVVVGIVAGTKSEARALVRELFCRQFKSEYIKLPMHHFGDNVSRVLIVLTVCVECGRVMLGNGQYCSVTCEQKHKGVQN